MMSGQIKITPSENFSFESERELMDMDYENLKDSDNAKFDSLKLGFKLFDAELVKPFLIKGLLNEVDELKNAFKEFSDLFNKSGMNKFKENSYDGSTDYGRTGYARFVNSSLNPGSLEFKYFYNGEEPKINRIWVIHNGTVLYEFPLIMGKIESILSEIESTKKTNRISETIVKYKELVSVSQNLEDYYDIPTRGMEMKSSYLGSLAWYCLLSGNGTDAIKYSTEGLSVWKGNIWIHTNLALGYVLEDNFDEASKLYLKYGNLFYHRGNKKFKEIYIEDLEHLKSLGIEIPKYEEYKSLIMKM